MTTAQLQILSIDESLKSRLTEVLNQFESYRVYNDLDKVVEVIQEEKQDSQEEIAPKKRRISFLERLFITEYDD